MNDTSGSDRVPSEKDDCPPEDQHEFHIVGIGASAGGLEALEAFFKAIPADSGMAFVVVQHLSPDFKSHMEDLLSRRTDMAIHRVENAMEVEPNSVYLIPPNMEMIISEGRLLLTTRSEERTFSHPIDQFFRSLASDIGRYGIGVILSGTGSDGSRGIKDIHDAGGLVISQNEATAKFDGMPLNAQATGIVDLVLPPAGIAEALTRYIRDGLTPEFMAEEEIIANTAKGLDRIFQLLNQQHNLDFSHYKSTTVGRRIQRRVELKGLRSVEEYIDQLEKDPGELNDLYKDLLIGVTKFFRDPEAFEVIEKDAIPKIMTRLKPGEPIRVWVAGCATGEEAYSIAILLDEAVRKQEVKSEIKIFATDAHHVSLHNAAKGIFREESLVEISEVRRDRYFRKQRDGYHVARELRRHVVFAPHNLIRDAPFTQMHLVTCRNLLIYLQPQAQKKALSMFHFALKASGFLFLGPSESPGEIENEFSDIDKRWRIYSKKRDIRLPLNTRMPLASPLEGLGVGSVTRSSASTPRVDNSLIGTYDRLLDRKMPPSFLVNEKYEMLHTFGGAERFLKLRSGRPTLNLLDLINESLKTALSGALQHAHRKQDVVKYTGLEVPTADGVENVQMTVEPITDTVSKVTNLLVEIESLGDGDAVSQSASSAQGTSVDLSKLDKERVASLESELRYSQENLQATVEEMETTNEELQATNEELVASNEELQSTNEELHSVNEELYTVNAENQRRMEELAIANEDMDNLLATTRVGVVFLDTELFIRRFTPEIGRMFHLVPQDIGRSIEGFTHNLRHDDLVDDLKSVLEEQKEKEIQIRDRSNTPFLLRMLPYRSGDKVSGVVLTLIDVSSLEKAQADLEKFKFMAEAANDPFTLVNEDGRFIYFNPAFCSSLGYSEEEIRDLSVVDVDPNYDLARLRELSQSAKAERIPAFESVNIRKNGTRFPVEVSVSSVKLGDESTLFANVRNITGRKLAEEELHLQQMAIQAAKNGITITNSTESDCPIIYANPGFLEMTGYDSEDVIGQNCRFLQGEDTDPKTRARVQKSVADGKPCRVTIKNYRKDGTPFWNDLTITPVFNQDGQLTNFVGVQTDVTKQRKIQKKLEDANLEVKKTLRQLKKSEQAAKQASLSKSQFLANMSHELRTPMTAVLGFADMLGNELADEEQTEKVDTIKRNGNYLLALLNDILDLSKIEAGKLSIAKESVDIRKVIEDVKSLMNVRAIDEGVPLSFKWKSKVPAKLTADHVRLRQILVNLIANALKFTDEGQVTVTTELKHDPKPTLEVSVVDTGIGMTEEQQEKLFEPFYQATESTSKQFGGTGLGLSISRRLAQGMKADIRVSSQVGVGSEFTLSIPVQNKQMEDLVDAAEMSESPKKLSGELPELSARILMVDDRRDVWRVGKYFLETCGATVTIAEDGRQGVDAAERARKAGKPFDLILMDMQMPVMTGQEAVAELRRLDFKTPIIALTADAMDGERETCLRIGCDEYSAKPIDGPKLMNLCATLLNRRTESGG